MDHLKALRTIASVVSFLKGKASVVFLFLAMALSSPHM